MKNKIKYNIVVVDDEKHICDTVNSILRVAGYNVKTFTEYKPALDYILSCNKEIDIVITDYKLADLTGVDLLENVRNIYPEISVVIMTGYDEKGIVVESLKSGAEDFLDKPFKPAQIRDTVQKIILNKEKFYYRYSRKLSEIKHEVSHHLQKMKCTAFFLKKNRYHSNRINQISDNLENHIDVMDDVINTMLEPENLLQQTIYIKKTETDLKAIVESILEILESNLDEKNIKLSSNLSDIKIRCDYIKIIQVVMNVIMNAIIYSPENSNITVNLFKEDSYAVLTVADEGIGISEENKNKIFNYGTRVSSKIPGSGIGLFFAKNTVERHKGKIEIFDNNRKGSIFKISLPIS
jgi:signal transduction histidine kinase